MSSRLLPAILVLLAMVSAPGAALLLHPTRTIGGDEASIILEEAIPKAFGDWHALDDRPVSIISPDQAATFELIYDQTISRTYVNRDDHRVMLSVAYGKTQTQRLRAHRQEVCYSAQGFAVKNVERREILVAGRLIPATRFIATGRQREEPVTYWFTMGDKVVMTYADRELQKLKYALTGFIPDGYLFRVSSLSDKPGEAFELQQRFAEELLSATDPRLSQKLLGEQP